MADLAGAAGRGGAGRVAEQRELLDAAVGGRPAGREMPRKQRRAAERAVHGSGTGEAAGQPGCGDVWRSGTGPRTITRRAGAPAAGTWRTPLTWAWRWSYLARGDPGGGGSGSQHDLHEVPAAPAAAACRGPPARRAGFPCCPSGPGLPRPGRLTWWSSSMSRWSGAQQLIADVTGAAPSRPGSSHSCLRQAASPLAAEVVRLIRTLITAAAVAGFDGHAAVRPGRGSRSTSTARSPSSTPRSGWAPAALDSMLPEAMAISSGFAGHRGSDRYQNYFHPRVEAYCRKPGVHWLTSCATTRTVPRPTRRPSGPCRRSGHCAA